MSLRIEDFCRAFGILPSEMPRECTALIERLDFRYSLIRDTAYKDLLLRIIRRYDDDTQKIAAAERTQVWHQGWQEALESFVKSEHSDDALVPRFIRPGQPIRVFQQYVESPNPRFEYHWVELIRTWFLSSYFGHCDHIWEFGCGTGFNLVAASRLFPNKQLWGSDFVSSAVELVNKIAEVKRLNLKGFRFDMLKPDFGMIFPPNSGVFTFGSLEQLGGNIDPMLNYLLGNQPKVVVHVEPAAELYDPDNLHDYLALRFQNKRGYTAGLVNKLKALHESGRIELSKIQRTMIGSMLMEGYNIFVWRPNGTGSQG